MAKAPREKSKGMPIVSLFCGAGGLDKGFHKSGFNPVLAFDHAPYAINTYLRNFPGSKAYSVDIGKLSSKDFLKYLHAAIPKGRKIGFIAGPPCQGFSRANNSSSHNDPRNKLINKYIDLALSAAKDYRIQFIVMENVSTLRREIHASRLRTIQRKLELNNFEVRSQILNSSLFGVAQRRERLFFVALSKSLHGLKEFTFPVGKKEIVTVSDKIAGLPKPITVKDFREGKRKSTHPNHWTMTPKSSKFQNHDFKKDSRSFIKLEWNKPSRTVAYGHREIHVHPSGNRRLSIFEAMLIQGFPKEFVLKGNFSEQVTMVSNAVPPPMAHAVAKSVGKAVGM